MIHCHSCIDRQRENEELKKRIEALIHDGLVMQRQLDAVATEEWDALKAENKVLRDENVLYNKKYLELERSILDLSHPNIKMLLRELQLQEEAWDKLADENSELKKMWRNAEDDNIKKAKMIVKLKKQDWDEETRQATKEAYLEPPFKDALKGFTHCPHCGKKA